jgi:transposase
MTAPDCSESADVPTTASCPIGIDVSKAFLDAVLLSGENGRSLSRRVPNTENGFAELLNWIDQEASRENVHVCLEASGSYHRSVARYLHEQNVTISVVNPRRTSAYAKSQLARSKTDQVDAALLARFCQREEPSPWHPTSSARQDLKEMTRGLQGLKQERDRLQNRLDQASNQTVIRSLQAVLESINEQIDELEGAIEEHVQSCRALAEKQELLQTIPGVGAQTASQVIAELGETGRFDSARQAAAYAGLTPTHYRSGSSIRRKPRLSKVGSSRLRKALYFPALAALQYNDAIRALGDRLANRGKAKMVIVGAAMRKLLHICYGVLKNGTPFDASLHPGT